MKKIFILIFVLTLSMFTIYMNANIISISANANINELEKTNTNYDNYIEPAYGDDEATYAGDEALSDKDEFEKNNSFKKATNITNYVQTQQNDEIESINATLHEVNWLWVIWRTVDEDYYRLDLFGDAYLTLTLDVPNSVNYDMELFYHKDLLDSNYDKDYIVPIDESMNEGIGITETICIEESNTNNSNDSNTFLTAGTYYIRISSHQELYASGEEYTLTYEIDYLNESNEKIDSLRFNKGAKAAIWKSDFDPYGFVTYKFSGDLSRTNSKNPFHDIMEDYSSENGIVNSVLYIWDTEWRNELADYLDEILEIYNAVNNKNQIIRITVDIVEYGSGFVGIVLKIVGAVSYNPIVSGTGEIISEIGSMGAKFAHMLLPEVWETSLQEAIEYFESLSFILRCNENIDSTEVIAIKCKYTYEDSVISFYPSLIDNETFVYDSNDINCFNLESHTYGKIYPLTSDTDWNEFMSKGTLEEKNDINTCPPINLELNEIKEGNLIPGKYYWYKFIAPSTGTYNFYSSSVIDTYGELFSSVDPARKTDHRLANGYNDDSGEGSNFSISYQLTENQVVYLRVRGYNWAGSGTFAVTVDKVHIHSYTYSYEQDSSTKHKAYCSCGSYISEDHTLVNGTCSKCGETETTTHTHNFIYTSCGDGATHRKRCLCGYLSTEPCMGLYEPGNGTVCTKCGQNMSNGGALLNGSTGDENIVLYHDEEDNLVY